MNPNPSAIPDAIWQIWKGVNFPAKLGGIYAHKPGYHNTVAANRIFWPRDYSIRVAEDLKGDFNKSRAIDLTMSGPQMQLITNRLKKAVEDNDPRLAAVREFYGTLDGKNVFGRIKDSLHGKWRSSTADKSHLWHLHISFFTSQATNVEACGKVLKVLNGEGDTVYCQKGDQGPNVEFLQRLLYRLGFDPAFDPKDKEVKPNWRFDGIYGDSVAHALLSALRSVTNEIPQGERFTPKAHLILQEMLAKKAASESPAFSEQWEEQLQSKIQKRIEDNLPSSLFSNPSVGYIEVHLK